jgi:AAA domain
MTTAIRARYSYTARTWHTSMMRIIPARGCCNSTPATRCDWWFVIDVAKRFPRTSLWEAYERSKRTERWVFPETICSSVTLLYGRSNVGKSYLVSSMLLSLLIEGRDFPGMQPADPTKLWKPAILWTDPGSQDEYSQRICDHLPEGESVEIPFFHLGKTTGAREWEALTESLLGEGVNIVVLDNLMGATGDTNDSGAVVAVFDGLTRLTNRGVPAVVVHHESEHGLTIPGAPPMGQSVTVQSPEHGYRPGRAPSGSYAASCPWVKNARCTARAEYDKRMVNSAVLVLTPASITHRS